MGFYEKHILPRFLDVACGAKPITYQRRKVVPQAEGRVLEIGMGSGLNLPYYDKAKVEMVFGLEPSEGMRERAAPRVKEAGIPVEFIDLPGEEIPLDANSVDTVLLTYTLCTIPDGIKALEGMARVLKPGGKLIFCEHGKAPDMGVARWQDRINPMWKKIAGGCNLNRPIPDMLAEGGFRIEGWSRCICRPRRNSPGIITGARRCRAEVFYRHRAGACPRLPWALRSSRRDSGSFSGIHPPPLSLRLDRRVYVTGGAEGG